MLLKGLYLIANFEAEKEKYIGIVREALSMGIVAVQYRDKVSTSEAKFELAQRLQTLCENANTMFIINDDIDLAAQLGSDGVHVGRDDGSITLARQKLGATAIVGASCYGDIAYAKNAKNKGADYVSFGAAYASPTKPQAAVLAQGFFSLARTSVNGPIAAIGGIKPDNCYQLVEHGVDLIAVASGIMQATDIAGSVAAYQKAISGQQP